MPKISELLFSIGRKEFFTSIDLLSAYWSISLAEDSKHLTAFSTHSGRYEFNSMAMGLVSAASVFLKALKSVLAGIIDTDEVDKDARTLGYMDDLLIISDTKEGNLK